MVSDKFNIIVAETSLSMTFSDYGDGVTEHFTTHGPHLGQSQATSPTFASRQQVERRSWESRLCHDMVFEWWDRFQTEKWHDMTGDTSWSETRQVGSGRPRGGSFRGRRGDHELIAPDVETGTNGDVKMSDLRWFFWSLEWCFRWETKLQEGVYLQRCFLCHVQHCFDTPSC